MHLLTSPDHRLVNRLDILLLKKKLIEIGEFWVVSGRFLTTLLTNKYLELQQKLRERAITR